MCWGPRGFITIWKEVIGPGAWLLHTVHAPEWWLRREVSAREGSFLTSLSLFLFRLYSSSLEVSYG